MYSEEESEIKSTDGPDVRGRKELNARTRATMASLRQRMEQAAKNKVGCLLSINQSIINPYSIATSRLKVLQE